VVLVVGQPTTSFTHLIKVSYSVHLLMHNGLCLKNLQVGREKRERERKKKTISKKVSRRLGGIVGPRRRETTHEDNRG
jgi:hypothetical protein